jgi:hypothetical protein
MKIVVDGVMSMLKLFMLAIRCVFILAVAFLVAALLRGLITDLKAEGVNL